MSLIPDKGIKALCIPESIFNACVYEITERVLSNGPVHISKVIKSITNDHPMIVPFEQKLVKTKRINNEDLKIISYGLSSFGYDVRLSDEIKLFTNVHSRVVDPMAPDPKTFVDAEILTNEKGLRYFILPPNSYALGATLETFNLPRDVTSICLGKSTYARSCILINTTPIEAGFKGEVVIEISNNSTLPVMVYLDGGIAQFLFFTGLEECEVDYADRDGKYQNQSGITLSKV